MALLKTVLPKVEAVLDILKEGIDSEVEKGNIRRIKPIELLMNIISLNVIVFLSLPLLETLVESPEEIKSMNSFKLLIISKQRLNNANLTKKSPVYQT